MKHTPGPWHCGLFRETGSAAGIDIGAVDNSNVALAHHDKLDRDAYETKANALLIAAAPDLLRACQGLINEIDNGIVSGTSDRRELIYGEIRAAIAKAEGGAL